MATDVTNVQAEETVPEQATRTEAAGEIAELNMRDPHFMDTAYDRYDELRARGPVVRVRLGAGAMRPRQRGSQRIGRVAGRKPIS